MSDEARADGFIVEAQKKLESSKGFFGKMFGGQVKVEEACDLYSRAGNSYKMAKKWSAAGNAFSEVAKLQLNNMQSKHEAATQYVEAANCYRKSDFQEAIHCLEYAIEIFTDMGRFAMAAKHHVTIAEIYESNIMDIDKAIIHYTQAADYYKGEESSSSANKCLLKVAMYAAQQENYIKAIGIYEEVAAVSLENSLLKYSAREYLFKASLCQMCVDMVGAQKAIDKYNMMFPAFEDSREMKLLLAGPHYDDTVVKIFNEFSSLSWDAHAINFKVRCLKFKEIVEAMNMKKKLIEAHEEENVDNFSEAVREYDSISRLDQWYTTILLRIKKSITGGGEEEPDLR